ncbi:MAG: tryptophan 7-halogenase [Candidatus Binatia bacterium]|nr:tryptophan 7-halogenase [Candidatus Binatia bacterium]
MNATPLPLATDVVVAGGGPAGATIARLLAEFGFRVVLLEKRRFPRPHIGESLTPHILPILHFLGLRSQIEGAGFLRMVGHTVCWGTPHPRTFYYSPDRSRQGWQVWRADFDRLLLAHARAGGVQVYEGRMVTQVHYTAGAGVTVYDAQGGRIHAAFFVDASGHTGILARQGLRRRDAIFHTLALTGYWRGADGPPGEDFANTILETFADGMVWSAPLHNGLRNVTLLVDWRAGQQIRRDGLLPFYLSIVQQLPYLSTLVARAELAWPPHACDATLYTASAFAGAHFLLVGDAGVFIDPLSSEGVHKAMASAITGAVVVNTILRRPTMLQHAIRFYEERQQTTYQTHYTQSVQYYRQETRWPESEFWRRRSQASSDAGSAPSPPSAHPPHPQPPSRITHVRLAPGVTLAHRPVVEGPYIELREVALAPRYPRGVRFLQGVHVPTLLHLLKTYSAIPEVMTAYLHRPEGRHCPPESLRQVLARLYQEGVLIAGEAADRRDQCQ